MLLHKKTCNLNRDTAYACTIIKLYVSYSNQGFKMNFKNQDQDEYLRQLYAEAVVDFDKDPLDQLTHEENQILCQPQKIFGAARTLFEQYAEPDPEVNSNFLCTPSFPVKYADARQPEHTRTSLFISHIKDQVDTYAIVKKESKGVDFIDLPICQFVGYKNEALVLGPNNSKLEDPEELANVRLLLKQMREKYQKEVRDLANSVRYSDYLSGGEGNFDIPEYMYFYFGNKDLGDLCFQSTTGFDRMGKAFEVAINKYYNAFGDKPTPKAPSSVKLLGVSLVVNDKPKLIDKAKLQHLGKLFRELTTFDSDKYTVEQMRQDFIKKQIAN